MGATTTSCPSRAPSIELGTWSIGTGTGSTWKVRLDEPSPDPLGRFECHCDVIPESWIYWGSINATGFSAEWVIEQIVRLGSSLEVPSDLAYARMEDAASGIEPGAEMLLSSLLGRPSSALESSGEGCALRVK